MRIASLFPMLLLCASVASAQSNYVPAVVATQNGDSIRGFVDYRNWNISPSDIYFKASLSDAKGQHFGPGDIKGFRLAEPDEVYIGRQMKIDITRQNIEYSVLSRELLDTLVFMQVLNRGTYNVYGYIDKYSRDHFFYETPDQPETIVSLDYIQAYVTNSAGSGLYVDKAYQKQLNELFKDCPSTARKASRLAFNEIDITNIFRAYEYCKHPTDQPLVKKKDKGRIQFGVMAGYSFNSFKFEGKNYVFDGTDYSSSSSPLIGGTLDVLLGRNKKPFAWHNELFYKEVKTDGHRKEESKVNIGFSYVQLNTMFQYTYPKGLIRPFVNGGLGVGFVISTKDNTLTRLPAGSKQDAIQGPRKLEQSLLGGVGVLVYKISIEARYATSNGFSPYSANSTTVNSFQVIAGLHF